MRYRNGEQSREMDLDRESEGDNNALHSRRCERRPRPRCHRCRSALNKSFAQRGLLLCLACIHHFGLWATYRGAQV